ncbi:zinc metallopeptidase [Hahella ganghwensis]|uniref:zinc metallopeptidase n=1 Tax=Hahella ganghwensis TaxID=286420 RepID=UPI0003673B18|nr:zinc metallopeptidase [Hahella ganghwensis]
MIYILVFTILLLLIAGPRLWIRHVLKKYGDPMPSLPGTGGELADHLIKRFQLEGVKVEKTESGNDHYSPSEKRVRLSPEFYEGRSLTAVAVAAHEVGHAIQYHRRETITHLRDRYTPMAMRIQQMGTVILIASPLVLAIVHIPQLALLTVLAGVIAMLASALMQLIILPMEWDASFNKAMPILFQGEYLSRHHQPAVKKILTAAALTYFAGALVEVFQLWRWLAILKGIFR